MSVIPENEKVIRLDQDDDEGWVDTHHGVGEAGRRQRIGRRRIGGEGEGVGGSYHRVSGGGE